ASTARALGLVRVVPGSGLHLTGAGSELADLYDEAARTARRHHLPGPVCEFTDRIRHVLGLLAPAPATRDDGDINGQGPATAGHQDADGAAQGEVLAGVRVLLLGWLARHPQAAPLLVLGQAA
ncbi:regulator, partial [Streptomyces acidiscabies]|uniref:regulator n=1 Tax=Streptomyces acidiscabies TaxID=42234 RepID=UPI0009510673